MSTTVRPGGGGMLVVVRRFDRGDRSLIPTEATRIP